MVNDMVSDEVKMANNIVENDKKKERLGNFEKFV